MGGGGKLLAIGSPWFESGPHRVAFGGLFTSLGIGVLFCKTKQRSPTLPAPLTVRKQCFINCRVPQDKSYLKNEISFAYIGANVDTLARM